MASNIRIIYAKHLKSLRVYCLYIVPSICILLSPVIRASDSEKGKLHSHQHQRHVIVLSIVGAPVV